MRLLHRINLDVPAGVEHQFRSLIGHADMQAAFNHDLIYGSRLHPALAPHILPFVGAAASLKRFAGLRLPRYPAVLRQRALTARIKRLNADIVLSWSGFAREAVAEAAKRSATPLVYREGGGSWFEHPPQAASRFVREIRGAICNTHASMRMLQLKWGYDGPAWICLGGIRPDLLAAADAAHSGAQVWPDQRLRIGVAARLASEKGVCLAIHTLKHLTAAGLNCKMDIAGDGPDRIGLQALVETLGLRSRIRFLGMVSDMQAFYRGIDVLLHPVLQEPLGNVTVEAQAFGVPVVATFVDGLAETIIHEQTGCLVVADQPYESYRRFGGTRSAMQSTRVYDPGADALKQVCFACPKALAEAVSIVVADPAVHTRMSIAAAAHAREKFSFDRHVSAFIDAVRQFE